MMSIKLKKSTFFLLLVTIYLAGCSSPGSNIAEKEDSNQPPPSVPQTASASFVLEQSKNLMSVGKTSLNIVVSKSVGHNSFFKYFNVHDNENTSVEATKEIVKRFGGELVEIQAAGERLINFEINKKNFTFDPNRVFTQVGIKNTLANYGEFSPEAAQEINNFVRNLITSHFKTTKLIVAVHNNTDGDYSIKSYDKGMELEEDAKSVYINEKNDLDNFFLVTDESNYEFIKEKGFNVVLQDNKNVKDDGSLSVYCGFNNISYINIESEHHQLDEQIKMLEVLQELIKTKNQ